MKSAAFLEFLLKVGIGIYILRHADEVSIAGVYFRYPLDANRVRYI